MKKINKVLLISLALTGIFAFPAQADGEATYAVVDSSGIVTNVIVCQASICGPSGSLNGVMPDGQRLILQVPANPVTGKNQGAFIGTIDNPVKYDSQEQVFTQGSASTPAPVTRSETVDTTTLVATIYSTEITFGPNNFIDGQMKFDPKVTPTTGATISATSGLQTEIAFFDTPKTRSQIQASIENKLRIIQQYLNRFYILLNGWLVE